MSKDLSEEARAAWAAKVPAEPGRHWLDRRAGARQGELARVKDLGLDRDEAPGAAAMAAFRARDA